MPDRLAAFRAPIITHLLFPPEPRAGQRPCRGTSRPPHAALVDESRRLSLAPRWCLTGNRAPPATQRRGCASASRSPPADQAWKPTAKWTIPNTTGLSISPAKDLRQV
ncbi:putative pollen-specific leucine-rich repeat extensin-like protein 3 [Iris pallida]|uniref:Pollen-specific leucine-rich repeat extensin-like protein 3 n=1 Tax=Iris pallida TaxID=29817 RepID=A0AAX6FY60_IRIPA|nr:putative pollen-specific leucine-rich repeat extensin-like protein 3 [Iris pallida]